MVACTSSPQSVGGPRARTQSQSRNCFLPALKRDLIGGLPKMRRAGRIDVSDLKVSINALTPISEPLFAVA